MPQKYCLYFPPETFQSDSVKSEKTAQFLIKLYYSLRGHCMGQSSPPGVSKEIEKKKKPNYAIYPADVSQSLFTHTLSD